MANQVIRVTIPLNDSVSNYADLGDDSGRFGLLIDPAGWTAAAITFQVASAVAASGSGATATWFDLYDDAGAEVTIASTGVVAGRAISLATAQVRESLAPWRYIRVRSGVAATPVNQAAARTLIISTER